MPAVLREVPPGSPSTYPSRNAATDLRETSLTERDCVEWPAPGTTTSFPFVVRASSCFAHSSGVERSWLPFTSNVGTRDLPAVERRRRRRRPGRHWRMNPLPVAVARSNGKSARRGQLRDRAPQRGLASGERRGRVAPRVAPVAAERARVQALVERVGGRLVARVHARDERLERPRRAVARRAQRSRDVEHGLVGRVDDAVGGERVESVDAVVVALDDRREVVDARVAADTAQHARGRRGTRRRRDRSARHGARPSRARASTRGRDVRARTARRRTSRRRCRRARSCRRRAPAGARRCRRRRRRCRRTAAAAPSFARARAHGGSGRRVEIRSAHLLLHRLAVERAARPSRAGRRRRSGTAPSRRRAPCRRSGRGSAAPAGPGRPRASPRPTTGRRHPVLIATMPRRGGGPPTCSGIGTAATRPTTTPPAAGAPPTCSSDAPTWRRPRGGPRTC